jgi:hypothetical protein
MNPSVRAAILSLMPFAAAGVLAAVGDVPVNDSVQTAEAIPSPREVASMAARFAQRTSVLTCPRFLRPSARLSPGSLTRRG